MSNKLSVKSMVSDGVDLAYQYGGELYGRLTETFWTALGAYERPQIPKVASASMLAVFMSVSAS